MEPGGLNNWIDILTLSLYFVFVLIVGIWSTCRKGRETVKGYFLAGREMIWLPIGFSLFASNIGSEHFIGLAGSGASGGIAAVIFEWGAIIHLLLLGWIFVPVYLLSGVYTVPEFLEKRYGGTRLRIYFSCISMFMYIASKISVDIFAGAVFIQQALGWNTYISIVGLLVITAVFTVAGGLAAVVFTDTLQTTVMIIGSIILSIIGFVKIGGYQTLYYKYFEAIPSSYTNITHNNTCGLPREDSFHIFRDPVTADYPWPGLVVRIGFGSMWYWCADQVIVQRALAAKNIGHVRGGAITAGYLKLLPMFIMVLPGMISRVLYPDEVACVDPQVCKRVCDNEAGCSNIAYPKLVLGIAPPGMRGLMMAVMMAALMSSMTSILNSAATVFSMDFWKKFRTQASEKELVIVGRIFVIILTVTGVAWVPLVKSAEGAQLFYYMQAITSYVAPPIVSSFLLTMFVPWITEPGIFFGLIIGHASGITRLILDFTYPSPHCNEPDNRPAIVAKVNSTYIAVILLVLTAIIVVIISLITRKRDRDTSKVLTYWTIHNSIVRGSYRKADSSTEEFRNMNKLDIVVKKTNGIESEIQKDKEKETNSTGKEDMTNRTMTNSFDDSFEDLSVVKAPAKMSKEERMRKLIQKPFWSIFLNVNAVLILCILVALCIIFR